MIDVNAYKVTFLDTNCYLLTDKDTGEMAVVDPGGRSDELISQIKTNDSKLKYVLLTHGHFDHIGYAKQLAQMFGANVVIGSLGADFLNSGMLNLSDFHRDICTLEPFSADILLEDEATLSLGKTLISYISTPGHTKGCGGYIIDDKIFSGDTLFCESYGRTDLYTGSDEKMKQSLLKLKELHGNYSVYPGHGPSSTLEHERKYNPLMRKL